MYLKTVSMPEAYEVPKPIWNTTARPTGAVQDASVHVILPREFLAWSYKTNRAAFDRHFGGQFSGVTGHLKRFGQQFDPSDKVTANHPYVKVDLKHCTITIGSHSDGMPLSKSSNEGLRVLAWNSLLGSGSSLDSRVLFAAIPTSIMLSRKQHHQQSPYPLWAVFRWSLTDIANGKFPDRNHKGELFSETESGSLRHVSAGAINICKR
jgi:hypothetical protein